MIARGNPRGEREKQEMGGTGGDEEEQKRLLVSSGGVDEESSPFGLVGGAASKSPPADSFHLAYAVYFTLGAGYLLPWNAFITAVDYFAYLYPGVPIDRVFSVAYMLAGLLFLVGIIAGGAHLATARLRINAGLVLFALALLIVPIMDVAYVQGVPGSFGAYDVTVAAVVLCGIADALVQGSIVGSAGEMPERYMQAVIAGTAASGVLVSVLRVLTKAVYPQDAHGLRKSANLYFAVSIAVMVICIVCYNIADRLPVVQYYKNTKKQALKEHNDEKDPISGSLWKSSLSHVVGKTKWSGFGMFLIYVVTLSIFPGYITEDVHSDSLKDWYPIILIAGFNVFDMVGKSLTAVYLLENENTAVAACAARLVFYPLFLGCLHGPGFLRTEVPVTILTCLLGLTNGYLTSVLMILAPKSVSIQYAETTGIVMVLFLVIGLASGSIVSWFWVL